MGYLGKPNGFFDLHDSDHCVGSYISEKDFQEIVDINISTLSMLELKFKKINNGSYIDENEIHKNWKKIRSYLPEELRKSNFDELLLEKIIKLTFPEAEIERQVEVSRYSMDIKLTIEGKSFFIEFDGPPHFVGYRGSNPKHPFIKRDRVFEKTKIEVINWAYWIQRCTTNVKALFNPNIKGLGALFSTTVHFDDFKFDDSADIIEKITEKFNAVDSNGYGYFYQANSKNRNNPQHPIIEDSNEINRILPKGYIERNYWLPQSITH